LLLRPRKFIYKNIFKRRFLRQSKITTLTYGYAGLMILQPLRLSNKQIFRCKLFLKKASKRSDKTLRFVWFNIFPHIPLSRKVEGTRMGKGKGKLAGWFTELPAGITIFEFKNLRSGRALHFCNQISFKLPIKTRFIKSINRKIPSVLKPSRKISYEVFW